MRGEIVRMAGAASEPEYMRSDTEFHLAVARATGNGFLVRAIEGIRALLNDPISLLPETDVWHSRLADEHGAIFHAIEAADETQAGGAMARHVEASNQGIRAILDALRRRDGGSISRRRSNDHEGVLAQLACRIGDVEGNTARAIDAIRSNPDVDIAVFPEPSLRLHVS